MAPNHFNKSFSIGQSATFILKSLFIPEPFPQSPAFPAA
jgi:hypothetical protein